MAEDVVPNLVRIHKKLLHAYLVINNEERQLERKYQNRIEVLEQDIAEADRKRECEASKNNKLILDQIFYSNRFQEALKMQLEADKRAEELKKQLEHMNVKRGKSLLHILLTNRKKGEESKYQN